MMRDAGIAVPKSMWKRAKKEVADRIGRARRRGAKNIDPEVAKFAGVRTEPHSGRAKATRAEQDYLDHVAELLSDVLGGRVET